MNRTYNAMTGTTGVDPADVAVDAVKLLGGLAAGALLMYLFDPVRGAERRAQGAGAVRDLGARAVRGLGDVRATASELVDRAVETVRPDSGHGANAAAATGSALARLGQAASAALDDSRKSAARVTQRARDALPDVPSGWRDQRPQVSKSTLVGGGLLAATGLLRRSPLAWALGLAGAVMLARGVAKRPFREMLAATGLHAPFEGTVDFEKSIHIHAAPEEVYDLWTNYENFPRFMSHVVEVRDLGRSRSHWVVRGPGGSEFAWNSVLTEQTRPYRLAWRSEPGAEIPQAGSIQLERRDGGTDVTVRMSYTPPAGVLGHGLATLLGSDPKAKMDEDLARMKAYIERGIVPPDAAQSRAGSRYLH